MVPNLGIDVDAVESVKKIKAMHGSWRHKYIGRFNERAILFRKILEPTIL